MSVFAAKSFRNHELVAFHQDPDSGLSAIIAIHSTALGPALGGCRYWSYDSDEDALDDVLRLSRGMTYKAALAGLSFGGGKAVIMAPKDSSKDAKKSPELLQAFGRFVHSLNGQYITAEDVGTCPDDMEIVHGNTPYVAGIADGGAGDGDPSPATAYGVFHGLQAAVRARMGRNDLTGVHVAVQGLGHVGGYLAQYLGDAGARLTVADLDADRLAWARDTLGADVVAADAIYGVAADVFAPNAMGAILNDDTIPRLNACVVAGSANNQLAEDRHGTSLADRGILYAPDYVINAGGIISISHEGRAYNRDEAMAHCARIGDTLSEIFQRAGNEQRPTNEVADQLAEERVIAHGKAKKERRLSAVAG
ncbi:MAG: amino acid dehydrogenase [Rhodospirillaceae bacterium]|jgi:leucine dehydrogenase|nr:amino acid dehydrogenase [Rhodospirillaceae bacterium]MBT4044520.1 amino acid dehydrogenase [Rhodospirillaceae bacterium]MBT4688599.1 amino acid dehydrogenase [Rhodospirillaceae bacterium]MBT5079094.1 amino acid dehydrogenase [Rhodospirillaceae bacterium]MBT5526187.1 amino acid dehydrogenase [Rhodospirillaceae bacterium]